MAKYLLGIAYRLRAIILCLMGTVRAFATDSCYICVVEVSAEPWVLCKVAADAFEGNEVPRSGPAL